MTGTHVQLRRRASALLISLLGLTICACICGSGDQSAWVEEPRGSDLVGVWEADYSLADGIEILIFREDGTYQQVYEDHDGYLYVSSWNGWTVSQGADGRVWVYLEGGRWFPHGPEVADLEGMDPSRPSQPHHFYDPVTNGFITMEGRLILTARPWRNSRGLALIHFNFDVDSHVEYFQPIRP